MRNTKEYRRKLFRRVLPWMLCVCLVTGSALQVQATESEGEPSAQTEEQPSESSSAEEHEERTKESIRNNAVLIFIKQEFKKGGEMAPSTFK